MASHHLDAVPRWCVRLGDLDVRGMGPVLASLGGLGATRRHDWRRGRGACGAGGWLAGWLELGVGLDDPGVGDGTSRRMSHAALSVPTVTVVDRVLKPPPPAVTLYEPEGRCKV